MMTRNAVTTNSNKKATSALEHNLFLKHQTSLETFTAVASTTKNFINVTDYKLSSYPCLELLKVFCPVFLN